MSGDVETAVVPGRRPEYVLVLRSELETLRALADTAWLAAADPLPGGLDGSSSLKGEDTQPESADSTAHLLAAFGQQRNLELSYGYREDEPGWCVHRVNGGVNDREWTLVAKADTPAEAIRRALSAAPEAGR